MKRGDQGIFYATNKIFPFFFLEMDDSWNLSYCFRFLNVSSKSLTKDSTDKFLGAVHFNCLKNKYEDFKGWEWLVDYYKWYRWDWISTPFKNYNEK